MPQHLTTDERLNHIIGALGELVRENDPTDTMGPTWRRRAFCEIVEMLAADRTNRSPPELPSVAAIPPAAAAWAAIGATLTKEKVKEAPTYPPFNFLGEPAAAKAILERHGWFVVGPMQKVSSPPPGYDPRVFQLMELTWEINRRLCEIVQR